MNPGAHIVLGIDSTDRDPTLVDSHADDSRPDAALCHDHRHPAYVIADLDEKQHALALVRVAVVARACTAPC